ncbi:MAG: hypothetical protein ABIS18_10855 [Actinomycetota bacterium]
MAIDERSRHGLYLKLEQVLGSDEATTLMEHLPPVGWADVATKQDMEHLRLNLEHLRLNLGKDIQGAIHAQTAAFRGELVALQRHMIFAMTGLMVSMAALAFGAAQLI